MTDNTTDKPTGDNPPKRRRRQRSIYFPNRVNLRIDHDTFKRVERLADRHELSLAATSRLAVEYAVATPAFARKLRKLTHDHKRSEHDHESD